MPKGEVLAPTELGGRLILECKRFISLSRYLTISALGGGENKQSQNGRLWRLSESLEGISPRFIDRLRNFCSCQSADRGSLLSSSVITLTTWHQEVIPELWGTRWGGPTARCRRRRWTRPPSSLRPFLDSRLVAIPRGGWGSCPAEDWYTSE